MELMAALAVVAAMLAFVIPSLIVASRAYKLKALANDIEGQLQKGRITAINRDKAASIVFSSDSSATWIRTAMGLPTAESLLTGRLRAGTA